jgi:hypothetical protein
LNRIFGDEHDDLSDAGLKMWQNLKFCCGRFNTRGELLGFGANNLKQPEKVVLAVQTVSALMAAKILISYYGLEGNSLGKDIIQMEKFLESDLKRGPYLLQANVKGLISYSQTGEPIYAHPVASIGATSWYMFYLKEFSPFE